MALRPTHIIVIIDLQLRLEPVAENDTVTHNPGATEPEEARVDITKMAAITKRKIESIANSIFVASLVFALHVPMKRHLRPVQCTIANRLRRFEH